MTQSGTLLNPFPGLRPFEPDEDYLFFGREKEVDELLRRLRTHRFLSVVGTSGSGKSSLVRSGLIPSLYGGFMLKAGSSWRVAIMRPGEDPIGRLAAALDGPDVLGAPDEGLASHQSRRARCGATPRHPRADRIGAPGAHPSRRQPADRGRPVRGAVPLQGEPRDRELARRGSGLREAAARSDQRRRTSRSTSSSPCVPTSSATAWNITDCRRR